METTYQGAQEDATEKISNAIATLGDDLDGIVSTSYEPATAAALILAEMENTRIKYIGIDDDDAMLNAIRDGWIDGTFAQSPYMIGYMPALLLKLLAEGYVPKQDHAVVDAGGLIVTKDNIDTYIDELWDQIYTTADQVTTMYFDPPAN